MDTVYQSFFDLLDACNGNLELLFTYLSDLLGSSSAAEQAIISEDIVI